MGLGKTVQTLAALQLDRQQGNEKPSLLVCPTSVINNWQREAARFTPDLPVLMHHGPGRRDGDVFREASCEQRLVITSYGTMNRDGDLLGSVPWRAVILDEAQNIKNPASQQARTARGLRADYRIALTGTPVENHVGDLWSIMQFLNPGLLGSQAEFKRNYFQPIQTDRDGSGGGPPPEGHRALHPAPPQDRPVHHRRPARQERDQTVLQPDQGAGHPLPSRAARGGNPVGVRRGH